MGFSFSRDGLCRECGYFTQENCDACGRFICPEHMMLKPIENSEIMNHVLCKDCAGTTNPKWFMHRTRKNVKMMGHAHNRYFTIPDS